MVEGQEPTDTYGTTGYGCACVSRDARNCILARYGYVEHDAGDGRCECLCHQWDDEEDDDA